MPRLRHSRSGTVPATSPTESLISQIRAAGDRLAIEPATDSERTSLDAQIRAIRRFGKLPPDLQLLVERPSWSKRVLTIAPLPGWMAAEPGTCPGTGPSA